MVNVTKEAAEKFNEIKQDAKNPENAMLRVSFGGYGWGGPKFRLTLDELKDENDIIVESQGIKVIYESDLKAYLNGAVINYSNNFYNRGFTIGGGSTSSCWGNCDLCICSFFSCKGST